MGTKIGDASMSRKEGSGLANATASAIERLTAAVFEGSSIDKPFRDLEKEFAAGRCGVDPGEIARWIHEVVTALRLPVVSAVSPVPDGLGDVRLTLRDGSHVWIEVKAQTTKRFRDLVQADWVRDATDAIRLLRYENPSFRRLLSAWVDDELDVYNPAKQFSGLTFAELWACDVGLLADRAHRVAAGVTDRTSLASFLSRKFVLHISTEGARVARLDGLLAVRQVLDGGSVQIDIRQNNASDATVWVGAKPPRAGAVDFIYYVGYKNHAALGRHKLNDHALRTARDLVFVR